MSCNEILDLLPLYLDDVLTPDEISQVDSHLISCESCRTMLELLREDQAALRSQPEVQVPSSFRRDLMARIEAEERPIKQANKNKNAWRYFVPRFSSLAAALLLIVLTTNLYFVPEYIEQRSVAQDAPPGVGIMSEGPDAQPENFAVKGTGDAQLTRVKEWPQRDPLITQAWIWSTGLSIVVFSGAAGFWIYRYRKQS